MISRHAHTQPHCCALVIATLLVVAVTFSLGGCPNLKGADSETRTLSGTWTGDMNYTVSAVVGSTAGSSYTFSSPFTVTFTSDGQPDAIDFALSDGNQVFRLPTTELLAVGDTSQASFDTTNSTTSAVTTTTISTTVTSITRSETSFKIELDVTVTLTGDNTGTLQGTCSAQAEPQPDGRITWDTSSTLNIGDSSLGVSAQITSTGTLSRQ